MAANSLIKEAHIQDIQTQTMHQIYGTMINYSLLVGWYADLYKAHTQFVAIRNS